METEPKWLGKLKELNILPTVLKEFDTKRHDSTTTKNYLYRLLNVTNNLVIVTRESFLNFYKTEDIKIGALENLIIKIPTTDFFKDKLKESYTVYGGSYSSTTYYGILKDLPKVGLRTVLDFNDTKYGDDSLDSHNYDVFVLGEYLAFNKISGLESIKEKDSKAILFTYLEKLEAFIFFLDSYWEVKRTPAIPPPMTFTKFVGSENEMLTLPQKEEQIDDDTITELLKEVMNSRKKKIFGLF